MNAIRWAKNFDFRRDYDAEVDLEVYPRPMLLGSASDLASCGRRTFLQIVRAEDAGSGVSAGPFVVELGFDEIGGVVSFQIPLVAGCFDNVIVVPGDVPVHASAGVPTFQAPDCGKPGEVCPGVLVAETLDIVFARNAVVVRWGEAGAGTLWAFGKMLLGLTAGGELHAFGYLCEGQEEAAAMEKQCLGLPRRAAQR